MVVEEGTYLFSGDQYVRYSTADYRYVDAGYPKPIAGALRTETAFAALPVAFDEELRDRAESGARALVDAVVAVGRTVQVIVGGVCHAASRAMTAHHDIRSLGRVRNVLAERGTGGRRAGHRQADAAVLRRPVRPLLRVVLRLGGRGLSPEIGASLPGELGIAALPDRFADGIDAAFTDRQGRTILFAGRGVSLRRRRHRPDRADRGRVGCGPQRAARRRAAWTPPSPAPTGSSTSLPGTSTSGTSPASRPWSPRAIPARSGTPGATCRRTSRPGSRARSCSRAGPTSPRAPSTSGTPDGLRRDRPDHAAAVRAPVGGRGRLPARPTSARSPGSSSWPGPTRGSRRARRAAVPGLGRASPTRTSTWPALLGWDVDELRWCRRHSRFLSGAADDEDRFELEFLLETADLFRSPARWAAPRPGCGRQCGRGCYETRRARRRGRRPARAAGRAGDPAAARALHEEMNVARRDALVPAVLALGGGLRTPADLFERFLIDVEMGGEGITSRVREAIAATQLYVHRYLLNLERGPGGEAQRQRVKAWWSWMRNYRVWEANRKVFLYPENYLRPELRPSRTPAFRALESDLLQGEITARTAEQAYKRYLDEYTEVSRLTIAGGYVYTKDREPGGRSPAGAVRPDQDRPAPLLLPPRRVRRRREAVRELGAVAAGRPAHRRRPGPTRCTRSAGSSCSGRRSRRSRSRRERTTVVVRPDGAGQQVSGEAGTRRVVLHYSFSTSTGSGCRTQTLGTGAGRGRHDRRHRALVRPRTKPGSDRTSILVSCAYTVTVRRPPAAPREPRRPTGRGRAVRAQPRAVRRRPAGPAGRRPCGRDRRAGDDRSPPRPRPPPTGSRGSSSTRSTRPTSCASTTRPARSRGPGSASTSRAAASCAGRFRWRRATPVACRWPVTPTGCRTGARWTPRSSCRTAPGTSSTTPRAYATAKPDEQPGAVEPIADAVGPASDRADRPGPRRRRAGPRHAHVRLLRQPVRAVHRHPVRGADPGYPKPLRGNDRRAALVAAGGRRVHRPGRRRVLLRYAGTVRHQPGARRAETAVRALDSQPPPPRGSATPTRHWSPTRTRSCSPVTSTSATPTAPPGAASAAGGPATRPTRSTRATRARSPATRTASRWTGRSRRHCGGTGTSWFFTHRFADRYLVVAPDGTSSTRPVYVQAARRLDPAGGRRGLGERRAGST